MKKLLFTAFAAGVAMQANAQTYNPIAVTGFNADVIANGAGPAMNSTTADVDGEFYNFVAQNFVNPGGLSPSTFLPANGLINSAATTGLTYQLAPYTGNNSLRLTTTANTGTLAFVTPRPADQIYLLVTTAYPSTFTATVNYTDGTNQAFTGNVVENWFFGTGTIAIQGISRVQRQNNNIENTTQDPRLYQYVLTPNATHIGKLIQNITIAKTTTGVKEILHVLAVSTKTSLPNDLSVSNISGISTSCGLNNQETVTITINNKGTAAQSNFPVSYQVNSQPAVTETFTGTVAPLATANYTFNTKANLSAAGTYSLLAKTMLATDANTTNDGKTISLINSLLPSFPVALDFEGAASGMSVFRTTTNPNSAIVEGAGASNGATSTKGLIMDGVNSTSWLTPTGITDPWANNPNHFAAAKICINPAASNPNAPLWLSFDLKQLYKTANANTNFRVRVNGTPVGPTYRPPFSGTPIAWQRINLDLSAYKNLPSVEISFESSVKEAYANGSGTANLIDNISVTRSSPTGLKEASLDNLISVFPNPGKGIFNVSLENGTGYSLKVTDLSGKTILEQQAKGTAQLNLEGAAKGIYLLQVSSAKGTAVRKLIVE